MLRYMLILLCLPLMLSAANHNPYEQLDTEKLSPITTHLSQVAKRNLREGLDLLHLVDVTIEAPLRTFVAHEFLGLTQLFAHTVKQGGRIIMIGAGSSGRIAVRLAAQHNTGLPVYGILAGGLDAFMRAKEGFEDSEAEGGKAVANLQIKAEDVLVLLSSSGSCKYNIGAAKLALAKHATVVSFTNVAHLPKALAELIPQGIQSVSILTGPQAIAGSTRLQSGRSLYFALSLIFDAVENRIASPTPDPAVQVQARAYWHIDELAKVHGIIKKNLASIAALAHQMKVAIATGGHVTYVAMDALPEVLIDTTELAPTYSLLPIRHENEATREEEPIRAFLLGANNNMEAWEMLCHCTLTATESKNLSMWRLGGRNLMLAETCFSRPMLANDLFIGVTMPHESEEHHVYIDSVLQTAKNKGAARQWLRLDGHIASPLAATIGMKEMLNLVSNGAMLELGKIYGNLMIDVVASNQKLTARTVSIIRTILKDAHINTSDAQILKAVEHARDYRQHHKDITLPSTAKIAVVMLVKTCGIEEAIDHLNAASHDIEVLLEQREIHSGLNH
jgi:N-acetylmuramic acid 6-phosphate etherase